MAQFNGSSRKANSRASISRRQQAIIEVLESRQLLSSATNSQAALNSFLESMLPGALISDPAVGLTNVQTPAVSASQSQQDAKQARIQKAIDKFTAHLIKEVHHHPNAGSDDKFQAHIAKEQAKFAAHIAKMGGVYTPLDINALLVGGARLTAPTITGTPVSATQITITWAAITGATYYKVETSANGGTTWSVLQSHLTTTTYAHTGLVADTAHKYRVTAGASTGTSVPSTAISVTTLPNGPTGLVAVPYSMSRIDLSWNLVNHATGYKLEQSTDQVKWTALVPSPALTGTSRAYSVMGLTAGTRYYFRVSTIDASGTSAPSTSANALTLAGAPTLTASVASATQINLSWAAVTGAASYKLERSLDGGTTWTTIASPTTTTYSNTSLSPDTSYKYRLSAVNATGTSAASAVVTSTTLLVAPGGIAVAALSPTQIQINWNAVTDATSYKIERSTDQTTWTTLAPSPALTGGSNNYVDAAAIPGITYYYRVSAIDAAGTSAASTVGHAMTYPSAPTLTATVSSATQINLSWGAVFSATSYRIETSLDGGINWSTLASPTTTTYGNTGLTASTTYQYRLTAINATGNSAVSAVATATTLLAAPTGLTATAISATEIDLQWSPLVGATGYKLEQSTNQTTWTTITPSPAFTGGSDAYAVTGLTAGTTYYYRVSGISAPGTSAPSTLAHALTYPAVPTVTATVASATQINLTWPAITGAASYSVQSSSDGGNTWTTLGTPTVTTYSNTGLTADTAYKYRVAAVNPTGSSAYSTVVTSTTLLVSPTGLAAAAASATEIDLAWTPENDATSYKIERSLNQTTWTTITPSPALTGSSSTYADTGLTAGTTYYYRISGIDAAGTSAASSAAHALTYPGVPTLTATVSSATAINLTWTVVTSATGYTVQTSTDGGTNWTTLGSPTTASYANTGLTADTSYKYRVAAVNATGGSAFSAVVTSTTLLVAPASLTTTAASATEIDLVWAVVPDATSYKLERSTDQVKWTTLTPSPALTGASSTYADTGLTAGTTYYYRVSAVDAAGTSAASTIAHALTYPAAPTLTTSATSATQINVSWTASLSATSYLLESSSDGGITWGSLATQATTTYSNTGLTADTSYKYRVTATNPTGTAVSAVATVSTWLPTPTNVTSATISATEVDLAWTAETHATTYKLERSLNQTTWTTITASPSLTGSSSTYADTGLTAGTTYYYRVSATNAAGTSVASSVVHSMTLPGVSTLTGTMISASQINLSWTAVTSATSYLIERSINGGTSYQTLATPTGTTYSDVGLAADGVYMYRISAVNVGGQGVASTVVTVATPLLPPTGLSIAPATPTEIDLGWTAVTHATGYKIERSPDNNIWTTLVQSPLLTGTSSTFADTTVSAGIAYYYRISAVDSAGTSAPAVGLTLLSLPNTPTLTATPTGATQITLSWNASTGAASYKLESSPDGSTWSTLAQPTGTTYVNTGLTTDTTYSYRISAVNVTGTSTVGGVVTATTLLVAPSGFAVTAAANGTEIDLAWTAVTHATNYKIERSLNQLTWTTVTASPALTGSSSTYADTALSSGTTYYYRLSSIDAAGTSAPTAIAHALTYSAVPTLTATVASATQINLSWTASAGAASYLLESSPDGSTWTTVASPTTTSYQDTGLTADTAYQYRVSSVNATGASATSTVATATTLLNSPAGLAATAISATEIDLAWTAIAHATNGYKIERSLNQTVWTTLTPSPALTASSSTYADTTLSAGTTYYYRVSAIDASGTSAPATAVNALTNPATPTLTATVASAVSVSLSWTPSKSATSYLLESSPDGSTWTTVASPTTTTYTNTGLTADTSYQYRVSAINATGNSVASSVQTVTTLLASPAGLAATVASATEIDLAWTAIAHATGGYKIERSLDNAIWTTLTPSPALTASSSTYADTTLAAGTTYYYRISAIDASGTSAPATAVHGLINPATPTLTATVASATSVNLSWTSSKSAVSYLLESSPDGSTWTTVASPTSTAYTNTGLTADTSYQYRVSAINATGNSVASSVQTVTTLLASPAGLAATVASATEIDLAWTAIAHATNGYKIERSLNQTTWTTLTPSPALTASSSTYADTTLSAGTTYYYRISAIDAAGTSAPATPVNGLTMPATPTLTATVASATSVNLAWTAQKSAVSYLLESSPDGSTWTTVASPTTTTYTNTSLTADTTYEYRVSAINASGNSVASSVQTVTTLLASPAGFAATVASATEIDLAWTAIAHATSGYKIERSLNNTTWTTLTPSPALTATSSTYADTTLSAGTTYYYRISAIDASGTSAPATAVHGLTNPATPTLSAIVASATVVNLTWTPSLSATSYLLESSPDGSTWTTVASPTGASYSNTGLTADTTYEYRVSATNATGASVASSVVTVTTPTAAPAGFTATAVVGTEIDLAWTAVTHATGYTIERSLNQQFWTTLTPSPALTGSSSTFADTTVSAGTTYSYRISATNANGTSAASTVATALSFPDTPTLTAVVNSATQVDLTWTSSVSATSYLVEYSLDGTTWTTLGSPTVALYSHTGLTADTAYQYRVSATNASGTSAPSTVQTVTTLLNPPGGFTVTAGSATDVDIAWTAVTHATGYLIERSDDNNDWAALAPSPALTATSSTFSDTTVLPGTTYYYRISSINAVGTSVPASQLTVLTPLAAPAGLTATAASSTQINLTWTTDTDAGLTGFILQSSTDNSTWTSILTLGSTANSASDIRLTTATTYYYRLIAVNAGGNSAPSTAAHATTL